MGFFDWFKSEEEEKEELTYEIKVVCLNCRNTGIVNLKKGRDVKSMVGDIQCSNCGLKHFAPYYIDRKLYSGEEQVNLIYEPISQINEFQIPNETIKFYEAEVKNAKKTT